VLEEVLQILEKLVRVLLKPYRCLRRLLAA